MVHVRTCKSCGARFTPTNSIYEDRCEKCLPGADGEGPIIVPGFGDKRSKSFAFLDNWAVEVIESWTPTAVELITSPAFWRKRIDEQIEYIARNNGKVRPEVIDSALTILERCQSHYYGFSQAQRIEALANEIVESNNRDE